MSIVAGVPPVVAALGLVIGSAYGALVPDSDEPGSFISQRVRIVVTWLSVALSVAVAVVLHLPMQLLAVEVVGGALASMVAGWWLLQRIRCASGGHRWLIHSLVVTVLLLALAGGLCAVSLGAWTRIPAALAPWQLLHLLGNLPTPTGLPVLYPFTTQRFGLPRPFATYGELLAACAARRRVASVSLGVRIGMCLQWCHTTKRLIDNDLPCIGCAHFPHRETPADQSCATCTHLLAPEGRAAFCGLSKAPLPRAQHCCHWNAAIETRPILLLSEGDVAPGVLAVWGASSIAELFARSDSAPEVREDSLGRVEVTLDKLAIPLVYGVPAAQWDLALGDDTTDWASTRAADAPPAVADAVVALLDALSVGACDHDAHAAHEALHAALASYPVGTLPAPWPSLLAEALDLYTIRGVCVQ